MMSNQTVILVRQRPLVSVTSITSASGGAIDISARAWTSTPTRG